MGLHRLSCAALVACLAWLPPATRAADTLRQGVAQLATDVKRLLEKRGEEVLAIGQFTGPASFPTSAGPGIAQLLTEELQKLGVSVKQRAPLGIKGEYQGKEIPAKEAGGDKLLAVVIKARLEDQLGNTLTEIQLQRTIPGEEPFMQLMGTTVHFGGTDTVKERSERLLNSYSHPQTSISGSRKPYWRRWATSAVFAMATMRPATWGWCPR